MASRTCRLCQAAAAASHAVSLFSRASAKNNLPNRISSLLDVSIDASDGFPQYVCMKCKRRLESLESAAEDLKAFRTQAKDSYASFLTPMLTPLKRTKESSGEDGVSPDIVQARPRHKRRTTFAEPKRLDFGPRTSSAGEHIIPGSSGLD